MIACLSLYQENYKPLADLTLRENRMEYCETHGYLPVFNEYPDMPNATVPEIHSMLGYAKIEMFLEVFEKHSHCTGAWFADCDGMVTNMRREIIFPPYAIVSSCDRNGVNCGSMFVPNVPWAKAFLKKALDMKGNPRCPHEAEAFAEVCDKDNGHKMWHMVPQRVMNSYHYPLYEGDRSRDVFGAIGQWFQGDFFIHWPGRTLEQRIEHYKEYERMIER